MATTQWPAGFFLALIESISCNAPTSHPALCKAVSVHRHRGQRAPEVRALCEWSRFRMDARPAHNDLGSVGRGGKQSCHVVWVRPMLCRRRAAHPTDLSRACSVNGIGSNIGVGSSMVRAGPRGSCPSRTQVRFLPPDRKGSSIGKSTRLRTVESRVQIPSHAPATVSRPESKLWE